MFGKEKNRVSILHGMHAKHKYTVLSEQNIKVFDRYKALKMHSLQTIVITRKWHKNRTTLATQSKIFRSCTVGMVCYCHWCGMFWEPWSIRMAMCRHDFMNNTLSQRNISTGDCKYLRIHRSCTVIGMGTKKYATSNYLYRFQNSNKLGEKQKDQDNFTTKQCQ